MYDGVVLTWLWMVRDGMRRYRDLDWRLDAQVATRSARQAVEPTFLLRFKLGDADATNGTTANENVVLQSDYANLHYLKTQLELALTDANSTHSRRFMRNVK